MLFIELFFFGKHFFILKQQQYEQYRVRETRGASWLDENEPSRHNRWRHNGRVHIRHIRPLHHALLHGADQQHHVGVHQ